MATANTTTQDVPAPEVEPLPTGARADLAFRAAGEMEAIAARLIERMDDLDDHQRDLCAYFLRLRDLVSVTLTALADPTSCGMPEALALIDGQQVAD